MADSVESQSDTPNSSITARPNSLPFSPASSSASFEDTDGTIKDVEQIFESTSTKLTGKLRGPRKMDQDSKITPLSEDFAENDASYVGFGIIAAMNGVNSISNNQHWHPSSMISWGHNTKVSFCGGDAKKDGIFQSKKKHTNVLSLCVDETEKLAVYKNGKLYDDVVVSTPTFCHKPGCSSSLPLV